MKNSIYLWEYSLNQTAISINGYNALGEVGVSMVSQNGISPFIYKPFRRYCLNDLGIDVIILNPTDLAPIGEIG